MVYSGIESFLDTSRRVGDVRELPLKEELHRRCVIEFSAFSDQEKCCFRFLRRSHTLEWLDTFNAEKGHVRWEERLIREKILSEDLECFFFCEKRCVQCEGEGAFGALATPRSTSRFSR